jgi:uncharacterized YigZ family protein
VYLKFVEDVFSQTYEIKKSKFIAYIIPYNLFDSTMKNLHKTHSKGRHFVYAYRYINEFNQVVENSSDDGEPKGTSGKPSLSVLRGANIINSAVIIVRYFGGIKLGTGGLVRAYGEAVNLVLENARLYTYKKLEIKKLTINYDMLGQIQYLLNQNNINILNKEFTSNVTLSLEATSEEFDNIKTLFPLGISF